MQRSVSTFAAAAAVVIATSVAGCGPSASAPDPVPVSTVPTAHKPAPPHVPAQHPAGAVFVLDITDHATLRPTTVDFASNATLVRMQWSHWGGAVADGHGTAAVRICTPSCVDGHTVEYPATVTLSHPASCFGAHFYGDSSIVAETRRGPRRLVSFIRNPC
jgi:hypothetical protein